MSEPSDFDLLAAWCDGDASAGQALFARHFQAVYRFFCNKIGPEVDDLVQDTFLAMTKARGNFRGQSTFRTFLFGVAYNQLLKHRERWARSGRVDAFDTARVAAIETSPSRVVARQQEHALLLQALRRLPLELQAILELFYWEGCTSAQISEALGVPAGTIRGRLRRGRAQLETLIEQAKAAPEVTRSTIEGLDQWLSTPPAPKQ